MGYLQNNRCLWNEAISQARLQASNIFFEGGVGILQFSNSSNRMQYGRVIFAPEKSSNIRQR